MRAVCGIAGIVQFEAPAKREEALLRRMLALLRHRGPDAFGIYRDDHAALGSSRLSIIDLHTGDQPIHNEDRSLWVVLNGELFTYPELRQELESKGHRFYTRTDTEILVHLYEERGPRLFQDLNGQFAFALWDSRRQTLLLGRDHVGIHPLFFHRMGRGLVFASEIKALFADTRITRRLNLRTLSDIFTCWAPLGAETPFEEIHQLQPAHYALLSRAGLEVHPYWRISFDDPDPNARPLAGWAEELQALMLDATRIRLRADVPVGAYLSGGLDSTYVSSLVKRRFNNRLCTFSVSFSDGRYDEGVFQNEASKHIRSEHRSVRCTEEDIAEVFPRVVWHAETPLLRTAPAPLLMLSRLVRQHRYKVVLTGEGADEIFAGYNIFKEDRVRRFWSRFPSSALRPLLLRRLYPYIFTGQNSKSTAFLEAFFRKGLREVDTPTYSHMLRWQNTSRLKDFFAPEACEAGGSLAEFIERVNGSLPPDFMKWHPLSRAQYMEMDIFLSNYLLCSQGDRMAMANSVEPRFPYLDRRVMEFAFRTPVNLRLRGLQEKVVLKEAARALVPESLLRRPKQPYRAPIASCFLGDKEPDYVKELLSEKHLAQTGYFEPHKVARLIAKGRQRGGQLISERENMALVGILSTQLLDHHFIRGFPPFPVEEPANVRVFTASTCGAAGKPPLTS